MKPEDADKMHFVIDDVDSFKQKLGERTMPNFYAVIREALAESDKKDEDIDYLAILHFKKSSHDAVVKEFGLKEDQTTYLQNYGHIGQNDQVLSMKIALEEGRLHDGDDVIMVGAGIGFVWAAAHVHWGEYKG
jgi:3-oxoacyl-[acyl-carrier-protein] synthase-3